MNPKIIAARSEDNVIGVGLKIPWQYSDDFRHFKRHTLNGALIMGRLTYESLPGVLSKRQHIVITRDPSKEFKGKDELLKKGGILSTSLDEALTLVENGRQPWIAGGAQIYELAMQHDAVNEMLITEIPGRYSTETAIYFPEISNRWHVIETVPIEGESNLEFERYVVR